MATKDFELRYWRSKLKGLVKPKVPIIPYIPARRQAPPRYLDNASAWAGIESILPDLIERFQIRTDRCLEFGVESGFSSVALSCYFDSVTGVDTFMGDKHTKMERDLYAETAARLAPYTNIELIKSDYRDFIRERSTYVDFKRKEDMFYGLIHVDIIHTFQDTLVCGAWSVAHSRCTIFHDTQSFPQVKQAVLQLARNTGKKYYNFEECFGLGILV
jgi:hypothetical protein